MIIMDNFLFILHKNIRCDPSSEPSGQDSSGEGSQHTVSMRRKIVVKYSLLSRALQICTFCIQTKVLLWETELLQKASIYMTVQHLNFI